ncbi:hypothetical protein K0M31_005947 [Melipona bicolor]|uniref:Uncharacterized protein n=1 Tax=Melipona bicolor TaxID=60889 RepID=A0AA40KL96_9HYME|nr:hypothetical protein K0M31_005947 [Melipona bicolor]
MYLRTVRAQFAGKERIEYKSSTQVGRRRKERKMRLCDTAYVRTCVFTIRIHVSQKDKTRAAKAYGTTKSLIKKDIKDREETNQIEFKKEYDNTLLRIIPLLLPITI